ncbi:TetR/AcrR family transcriptional regulator [Pseudonocardia spinosispora]|uniref:TetR/AcrR family transcriptional regulator n=1 Tax=Pseudonocardia spinosispora TaxID=103441 RepID=UPI000415AF08|nr:helix-turn-helix domain-containing protein [Pseudonocardia spinosispora]
MPGTTRPHRSDGAETRARLKSAAQRLFATRGIDGVTVRDLIAAARQRNNASLSYYFGSKEELARELIIDGARILDARRREMLGALEDADREPTVREILEVLSVPVVELSADPAQASYLQMIANLELNDRAFVRETLGDTWNHGYRRCVEYLLLLIADVPRPILEQRISLVVIYLNAAGAARERSLASPGGSRLWSAPYAMSNVLDTIQGMLEAPPSEQTRAAAGESARDGGGRPADAI